MRKYLYLSYVEFLKVFYTVKHEVMMKLLGEIGIVGKDKRMIMKISRNQKAAVQVGDEQGEWNEIRQGVRQGCVLSQDLFNFYCQKMIKKAG